MPRSPRISLPAAGPTIVFCRTRRGADRLATQLSRDGVRTEAIHGGRSQNQRDRALAAFKSGRVDALIATDVAARGIHVDGVACVVHFDTPEDEKAYLHRSGRTARAGATGVVVSFVPHADRRAVARMQRVLDIPGALTAPDVDGLVEVIGPRAVRVVQDEPVMSVAKTTRPGGAPKPTSRNRRRSNARDFDATPHWSGSAPRQPRQSPPRQLARELLGAEEGCDVLTSQPPRRQE